jgi:hypothetical protein
MRGRDYRRKQEAKHYKKRLGVAVSIGRFSSKETGYQPMYAGKNNMYRIKSLKPLNDYEKKVIEKQKYKRWKFQLKNDSLGATIDTWAKRYCRRTRRHFQKMVDYKLPDKKWLVRAQVIYPRDIV